MIATFPRIAPVVPVFSDECASRMPARTPAHPGKRNLLTHSFAEMTKEGGNVLGFLHKPFCGSSEGMSWIEHHRTSERFASQAEAAMNDGRRQDARVLYSRAAKAESAALRELDGSKARTLGVSAVSAVSLHCKAGEFDRARE